jgi:hypothetical protein
LGGPGTTLKGDGKMDFVIGYPAQLGDQSDRFPCGDRFDVTCFGVYFFQAGRLDQPGTRFIYKTDAYNGFPAGLLAKLNAARRTATRSRRTATRISSGRSTTSTASARTPALTLSTSTP